MKEKKPTIRCAIYTRKSHEEGLDQDFNSLDAQRQAAEAYIQSQKQEGWQCLRKRYDDGGYTGSNMERPALESLIADIKASHVDCVVVYKVDRLSRSLLDFARLMSLFDEHEVSFVSVTQQFNTTTSMGRLTLNILLSFAQFEREIIGERIRDKKFATARQGKYFGGGPVLGLDVKDMKYVVHEKEAKLVRRMFKMLLELRSCKKMAQALNAEGTRTKRHVMPSGRVRGGKPWTHQRVHDILSDRKYIGQVVYKGTAFPGEHTAIVPADLFEKVQATLRSNKNYPHKNRVRRFALLRGVVGCGYCGSRVQPTWTKNHGRQYYYYLCTKKARTSHDRCPLPALPAGEIETAVVDQLRAILRHPDVVARTYGEVRKQGKHISLNRVTDALRAVDPVWDVLIPEEQHRVIQLLVESVAVTKTELAVRFRANGIEQIVEELQPIEEQANEKPKRNRK